MNTYCTKCRVKTLDVQPHGDRAKNGRYMLRSTCGVCGNRKSRFVSNKEIQGGALGPLFGKLTAKVTAPMIAQVAKKVLPALGMAAITGAISGATHKATSGQGMRKDGGLF